MVTITHISPKYETYQANVNYLSLLGIKNYLFINIDGSETSIPLEKIYINKSDDFDLVTPINFQESIGEYLSFEIEDIYSKLKLEGAVCFYMQMKDERVCVLNEYINADRYRTNFYFNLTLNEADLLKNLKKDARQRLKKAIKNISIKLVEDCVSECFYRNYARISLKNLFSSDYKFTNDQLSGFSNIGNIKYIELQSGGQFVAGGFFGFNHAEVDYLYGANSECYPDSIRLLIWEAIKYFKILGFKELYIGGGISENDSLASFKSRLGCNARKCDTLRAVLNVTKAEKYMLSEYSDKWYSGYFPQYRNKKK